MYVYVLNINVLYLITHGLDIFYYINIECSALMHTYFPL